MTEHVACGDCERIRPGSFAQPANTVSSLALAAVAPAIWRGARRAGDRPWQVVAATTFAAGVGSVAYHGPGGRVGKAVHDGAVAALAVSLAAAVGHRPPAHRWPAAVGVLAGALHATSRTGGSLCRPDSWLQGHAAWHVAAAVAVAGAARSAVSPQGG
ncbi:hypothetical protein [Euzebya sp.]|uniref:hypothetical protein n=1 Tax=Euzebya sp. TaxID=1971409 RepID=UPI0035166475